MNWKQLLISGAVSGALAAARTDFQAFGSWKTANDALTYNWKTAGIRVGQGAVLGALSVLGLGSGMPVQ